MSSRIIRHADLIRKPWKNGGGTTAEIAAEPSGAALDAFDWRISMADVASEGPFSTFPGIDRTLVLIEGTALNLDVDGVTHRLDTTSPSLGFPGDAPTSARLPAGPIRDFNLMTRRSRFTHRLCLMQPGEKPAMQGVGVLIVVALDDAATLTVDGRSHRLDRFDTLIVEPAPVTILADQAVIMADLFGR